MKKMIIALFCFWNAASFACGRALPTDDAGFCPSFKAVAACYCVGEHLPPRFCQNMKDLYDQMLMTFGSLKRACEFQHHTSTQDCIDNWTCYMRGGVDSRGKLCSSTKKACL